MQEQYKISEGNNQLVLVLNSEVLLPEDAPVRVTSAQLEELDYRKLNEVYSSKGRKWVTDSNHQTKSSNGRRKGQKISRMMNAAVMIHTPLEFITVLIPAISITLLRAPVKQKRNNKSKKGKKQLAKRETM